MIINDETWYSGCGHTRRSFSAGVGDGDLVKSSAASVRVASGSGGPCSLP